MAKISTPLKSGPGGLDPSPIYHWKANKLLYIHHISDLPDAHLTCSRSVTYRMLWFEQPLTCQFFAKRLSKFVNRIGSSNKRFCISWFKATESIICRSKIFISIFSWSFYWFFINWFWIWSFCRFWIFIFAFWLSSRWFSFRTSTFRLFFDFNGLNIITSLIYVCTPYW